MQPTDDNRNKPIIPGRDVSLNVGVRTNQQNEAANVVRGQLDNIYQTDPNATVAAATIQSFVRPAADEDGPNPYERTHDEQQHSIDQDAWSRYHSAWQSYYQQYYERYYIGQVHEAKKTLETRVGTPHDNTAMTEDEALYDLRSQLIGKVRKKATLVRKSNHFWPIMSALIVMSIFLFLQYNRTMLAFAQAYIVPGDSKAANLIVGPGDTSTVTADDRLIIPRITVDVPIIWDAVASSQDSLNAAMNKGVAWFNVSQAHSRPGEKGNFALSGHSSNDFFDNGDYKFIFAPLEKLQVGDPIYVNYQQKRYTYRVSSTKVVAPTDVSALTTDNSKPVITLITCTPLGTATNRLLVFADQVNPDPVTAAASAVTPTESTTKMPSNSPSFWERIFGGGR